MVRLCWAVRELTFIGAELWRIHPVETPVHFMTSALQTIDCFILWYDCFSGFWSANAPLEGTAGA